MSIPLNADLPVDHPFALAIMMVSQTAQHLTEEHARIDYVDGAVMVLQAAMMTLRAMSDTNADKLIRIELERMQHEMTTGQVSRDLIESSIRLVDSIRRDFKDSLREQGVAFSEVSR